MVKVNNIPQVTPTDFMHGAPWSISAKPSLEQGQQKAHLKKGSLCACVVFLLFGQYCMHLFGGKRLNIYV